MTYQATIGRQTSVSSDVQSEWNIERLDVDAYLKRVGYAGDLDPTVETLQALHRAHVATIPFENLDILLGRGISLEIDDIQNKLVHSQRGGYCYEHNLLFSALLERLGFNVTRLAARVQPDKPGPRTHMCFMVEASGERWLADTGFGTTLLEAVPLHDGAISRQEGWTYRLDVDDRGLWQLRSSSPEGWSDEYAFTLEPQHPIDYIVFNHYTASHPKSPFVNQVVALRKTTAIQYALRDRNFTVESPGQPSNEREVTDDELAGILEQTFGIVLTPDDVARLSSRP